MIAHAAGIMLDEITTTYDKWVTPTDRKSAKGVIEAGNVAAVRFTINGVYRGETRIQLEHVNRIGNDAAPDWPSGTENDVYRVEIDGTPASCRRPRSGSPTAPAATPPRRAAWPRACAHSTPCPRSTTCGRAG